ncbi:phosphatase PAP2 family protein [Bacteroidota bacterium]
MPDHPTKKYNPLSISLLLIFLSLLGNINAQNYDYNLRQFGDEFIEMLKQPGKWETKEWLTLTAIAGGTIGLMQIDDDVRSEIQSNREYDDCLPIVIGNKYGEWVPLLVGTSFLTAGILQDNNANKRFGFEVIQSYIYSLTITGIGKLAFGRARPFMSEGSASYHPFQMSTTDYFSLPSGHTTAAFSLSTVLAAQSDNLLIKIAAFTPAVMTAFARIYYDKHWLSDVFLGAAVGYFVGKFVTEMHENKYDQEIMVPPSPNNIQLIIPF